MSMEKQIRFEMLARLCPNSTGNYPLFLTLNPNLGADLRSVCTEAGMFAIRELRDYVVHDDFMKAARKLKEAKALESKIDYSKV